MCMLEGLSSRRKLEVGASVLPRGLRFASLSWRSRLAQVELKSMLTRR